MFNLCDYIEDCNKYILDQEFNSNVNGVRLILTKQTSGYW